MYRILLCTSKKRRERKKITSKCLQEALSTAGTYYSVPWWWQELEWAAEVGKKTHCFATTNNAEGARNHTAAKSMITTRYESLLAAGWNKGVKKPHAREGGGRKCHHLISPLLIFVDAVVVATPPYASCSHGALNEDTPQIARTSVISSLQTKTSVPAWNEKSSP